MSSKDTDEERLRHSKGDNIEIMIDDKSEEIIEKPFHSLSSRYQIGLGKGTKGSSYIFDHVNFLHCKCRKVNQNSGGSYKDSQY